MNTLILKIKCHIKIVLQILILDISYFKIPRHEIGEHVSNLQENLDMIQNLLTSLGPNDGYSLDMDSLLGVSKRKQTALRCCF